jgi:hypothetical protein
MLLQDVLHAKSPVDAYMKVPAFQTNRTLYPFLFYSTKEVGYIELMQGIISLSHTCSSRQEYSKKVPGNDAEALIVFAVPEKSVLRWTIIGTLWNDLNATCR